MSSSANDLEFESAVADLRDRVERLELQNERLLCALTHSEATDRLVSPSSDSPRLLSPADFCAMRLSVRLA
jgi:hypothetical protein